MKYSEFFSSTFLFRGIPKNQLDLILDNKIVESTFEKGETIFTPQTHSGKVGFVFNGECEIMSADGTVPLNKISVGESFGILSALSIDGEFPTTVYAKRQTTILFIGRNDLVELYKNNFTVSNNIINFLVDRIKFLNLKVGTFSADTVEKKLARYLISKAGGGSSFILNLKHAAEEMSVGRASLYRALSVLEDKKLIEREQKKITILSLKGLKEI